MNEYLPPILFGIINDLYPSLFTSSRSNPFSLSVVAIILLL